MASTPSGGDSSEPPESGGGGSAGAGAGTQVVVYHAAACHLCERVLAQVEALRAELGFPLETVDITGEPALEARYREWLPVVEIDGERAFVYYLDEAAFRRKLAVTKSPQT